MNGLEANLLTPRDSHEEHDIDERSREDRDRDQTHNGIETRQQARVQTEQNEAVDNRVAAAEARA